MTVQKHDFTAASAPAQTLVPPTLEFGEWDVLLALLSAKSGGLGLRFLAGLCSLPRLKLTECLSDLEDRGLLTGRTDTAKGEIQAVLTGYGRSLLRRYLAAADELQSN